MSTRISRAADLIKAEHAILALMDTKASIRAIEAKRLAGSVVEIASRRESAWDTLINIGHVIPIGKGYYDLTADGRAQLKRWDDAYGRPEYLVNQALNNTPTS